MISMVGYHGTTKSNGENILKSSIRKDKTIFYYSSNIKHKKKPGTLGYGFYIFKDDPILAKAFHMKFSSHDTTVLEINCEISRDKLLDLNDILIGKQFHTFLENNSRTIDGLYTKFGKPKASELIKQNVLNGIAVELFILELNKNKYVVDAVMCRTYTPIEQIFITVPNGTEVCIRNLKTIKKKLKI